jgi:hypothetical protein
MKKSILSLALTLYQLAFIFSPSVLAQSTEIRPGIVLPQMTTTQRTNIASPANGILVFDTNTQSYWFRQSGNWVNLSASGSSFWQQTGTVGNEIKNTNIGGFWSANPTTVTTDPGAISPPASGGGTRLFWMPAKGAFRAGTVLGTFWDASDVGFHSFATGYNTRASGEYSTALGYSTTASGDYSTALGYFTTASGDYSTALGYLARALHKRAIVIAGHSDLNYTDSQVDYEMMMRFHTCRFWTQNTGKSVYFDGNGGVTATGPYTNVSDARLKQNIVPLNQSLQILSQLNGYHYTWKQDKTLPELQTGVLAQEVQTIFPELVHSDKQGTLSVNYTGFIPHLIEAVKELKNLNEELKTRNETLERKNELLERKVETLQQLELRLNQLEGILKTTQTHTIKTEK